MYREAVREKVDGENSENCPLQQNVSMPHTRSAITLKYICFEQRLHKMYPSRNSNNGKL